MRGREILIVDDNDTYRNGLVYALQAEGAIVEGAESGEEAVRRMEENPQRYQFAVIDHVLTGGIDGIQTTKELVDRNQNLFALVFTNVPTDNMEDIARFKYDAFSAGACRYLERGSTYEAPKQVKDFIDEIDQLASLRDWIQSYYENREQVPSLMTQLDIGVDIIDRSYKVWFMNDDMRCITGWPHQGLPRKACSAWHGYRFCPCPDCLVRRTFDSCESHEQVFLAPLIGRDKERLFFMNVWTQPIRDQQGKILLARDRKPLAVMESVQDLTGTAQLRKMPLAVRLGIIAGALRGRPVRGSYLGEVYFEKVQIYTREKSEQSFVLRAASGFDPPLRLGQPVDFSAGGYLESAEDNMKCSGYGSFFPKDGLTERVVYWPIMDDGKTVAVLRVSGGKNCNEDGLPVIKSYAEEVRIAVRDAQSVGRKTRGEAYAQIESELAEIDRKLQTVSSAEEALRILVSSACEFTGSHTMILRYREKDDAVLLRLGLQEYDGYERAAKARHPLSLTALLSSRAIVSGQEIVGDIVSIDRDYKGRQLALSEEARKVLDSAVAWCFEPLFFGGRCIGAFGLYAKDPRRYSDVVKLEVTRGIAHRIAFALHDYLVAREAQKQVEDAHYETMGLVLHNIHTPLAAIRYALDMLGSHIVDKYSSDEFAIAQLKDLDLQVREIARIRQEFLKLQRNWESRIEEIDVHRFLRSIVNQLSKEKGVLVHYDLDDRIINALVDTAAVRTCLQVLLQNSLDALDRGDQYKQIKISLRPASGDESEYLSSPNDGLAIDVEDNGPGVPSEIAGELFSVIRSGKAKGLGLGLAFCRKVAGSAHGDVYYHDRHRAGAKFTLVLPYEAG